MDNFKIKSIDEFDLDFAAKLNEKSGNEISSVSSAGPIPEITKEENNIVTSYFDTSKTNQQAFVPENKSAPVSPAYTAPTPQAYTPVGTPAANEKKDKPAKEKQSKGVIAGKVITTILLVATIIIFVLGCFVTIFLDNYGSDLMGYCFNTVSADTKDSKDKTIASKGTLVISEKAEPSEYIPGELVVVKSNAPGSEYYSDIHFIVSVSSVSETSAEITTYNLSNPGSGTSMISSKDTYGIARRELGALGALLHFAMDNAILTCVLFVLLAAMWCLILVLIDNRKDKTKKQN